ncbi:MAG: hypothetical protein M1377_04060 [Deltaproteobacteria bacterium]|nr:hypothetical protein [Deltaproteobacteria bacterium]MDA8123481.1 hypothetical protein [Deltaproteobacteria bacterium]
MRIELLDGAGQVMRTIEGVRDAAEAGKFLPHYPGAVSWREMDPAVIAAEESARSEEERLQNALLRGAARVLFNYENRLRALEVKAPITHDQFKATLKAILGL